MSAAYVCQELFASFESAMNLSFFIISVAAVPEYCTWYAVGSPFEQLERS